MVALRIGLAEAEALPYSIGLEVLEILAAR
jgi:hypothetical protein